MLTWSPRLLPLLDVFEVMRYFGVNLESMDMLRKMIVRRFSDKDYPVGWASHRRVLI